MHEALGLNPSTARKQKERKKERKYFSDCSDSKRERERVPVTRWSKKDAALKIHSVASQRPRVITGTNDLCAYGVALTFCSELLQTPRLSIQHYALGGFFPQKTLIFLNFFFLPTFSERLKEE
jgi:hypothetical protein